MRTPEIAEDICQQLIEGKSLRAICRQEGMPDLRTVMRWLEADESFRQQYARAREIQAEVFAEEIVAIADDGSNDTYVDEEGKTHVDQDVIARSKLRVEARKWIACKLLPKKYGDKADVAVNVSGALSVTAIAERVATVSPLLERLQNGTNHG